MKPAKVAKWLKTSPDIFCYENCHYYQNVRRLIKNMESIYHLANGYCYLVSGWKEDNLTEPLLIKCQASLPFMVPILEKHVSLSYRETSTIYFRKTCCEFDRMSNSCKSNQVYPPWSSKRFISVLIQKYQTFILSLHLNIGPPFLFQFSLLRATCFFFHFWGDVDRPSLWAADALPVRF